MANDAKGHRLRRIFVFVAAGVLAISGLGFATATAVTNNVKRVPVFGIDNNRPPNQGGTNILLIGSDDRSGLSTEERSRLHVGQSEYGKNTDSMMIVHLANDGSVGVVSIPRDSFVDIPSHTGPKGITTPASSQKINAAYSIGGPSLAVATIEKNTGVHIDHFMEINFAGFVAMVDGLGGVPLCIKSPIEDEKAGLNLPAGNQTLDGPQALGYVRARSFDPSADLGRMKRQQTFLGATFKRATSPAVLLNPPRMISFLNAIASSITVDNDFSDEEIWSVIARMRSVSPSNITFQTIPIGGEQSTSSAGDVLVWDQTKANILFEKLRTGAPLYDASTGPAVGVVTPPSEIAVQVFNGSDVKGLGATAAADLTKAGYNVQGAAQNAPEKTGDTTVIEYDPAFDTSVKTLEAAFPDAELKEVPGLGNVFRITVGDSYNGVRPVTVKGAATPGTKPKTAADDPCA